MEMCVWCLWSILEWQFSQSGFGRSGLTRMLKWIYILIIYSNIKNKCKSRRISGRGNFLRRERKEKEYGTVGHYKQLSIFKTKCELGQTGGLNGKGKARERQAGVRACGTKTRDLTWGEQIPTIVLWLIFYCTFSCVTMPFFENLWRFLVWPYIIPTAGPRL